MTRVYNESMATRHRDFMANNIGKSITDTHLKLLSDDAYEYMRSKAKKRPVTFESEADISHVQAIMDDYRDDIRSLKNGLVELETILEDDEFKPKPYVSKPQPTTTELLLEDTAHLMELRRILAAHEVEHSFEKRLRIIIKQYTETAAKRVTVDNAAISWSLFLLRNEVQVHIIQRRRRLKWQGEELLEPGNCSRKMSKIKAIRAKFDRFRRIS